MTSENQIELPRGFTDPDQIRVVPDPVHYDSLRIQVHGPSQKRFSLIWSRVRNINYGSIWYEVRIQISGFAPILVSTSENHVVLTEYFSSALPYSRFLATITSATKWAKSRFWFLTMCPS